MVNIDTNTQRTITLEPADNNRLASLCGQFDEHLGYLEKHFDVEIRRHGQRFVIIGRALATELSANVLTGLYATAQDKILQADDVHLAMREQVADKENSQDAVVTTRYGKIRCRGANQRRYLQNICYHDISFGVGPAGTGKTYLAIACAADALERSEVRRIVLVRPAVEAGERLGFLPGDLSQKVDPYLRPVYDALDEVMSVERVARLIERGMIEIAPLAYMRGRTLNHSFIVLDESQNTTVEQMKMFLTRIGFGSTAVITGDVTQIDLPNKQQSGLCQAIDILQDVQGISFTFFKSRDVVRHPLVERIVDAYEQFHQLKKHGH